MEASAVRPLGVGTFSRLRGGADDRLVESARGGDERAFEAIFDRYHRPLLSFCRHMLGNAQEAEDAVQQTFLAAHRELSRTGHELRLRPWLYTVARNACLSQLRSRRESVSLEDFEPSTHGLTGEVEQREDLRELLLDVSRLPEDQRAALVLAELGALRHEEIADVVGCPREKVKALVFQARTSLITGRDARAIPCSEIREQLATLTGVGLRRAVLRRHLRDCAGCRQFRDEVRSQRAAIALILPVVPTAGLRSGVLSAAGGAVKAGGVATAGSAAAGALGTGGGAAVAAKLAVAAVLALGAGAGAVAVTSGEHHPATDSRHAIPAPASRATPSTANAVTRASRLHAGHRTQPSTTSSRHAVGPRGHSHARGKTHGRGRGRHPAGKSLNAPGHTRSSPGHAHATPASGAPPPAKAGASPGQAGTSPRRAGVTPNQGRPSSIHGHGKAGR